MLDFQKNHWITTFLCIDELRRSQNCNNSASLLIGLESFSHNIKSLKFSTLNCQFDPRIISLGPWFSCFTVKLQIDVWNFEAIKPFWELLEVIFIDFLGRSETSQTTVDVSITFIRVQSKTYFRIKRVISIFFVKHWSTQQYDKKTGPLQRLELWS